MPYLELISPPTDNRLPVPNLGLYTILIDPLPRLPVGIGLLRTPLSNDTAHTGK